MLINNPMSLKYKININLDVKLNINNVTKIVF